MQGGQCVVHWTPRGINVLLVGVESPMAILTPVTSMTLIDAGVMKIAHVSIADARISVADIDEPGEIVATAIDGCPLDLTGLDWARDSVSPVIYRHVPETGWQRTLNVHLTEPIVVTIEETKDGLPDVPGFAVEPPPAEVMTAPSCANDPTTVIPQSPLRRSGAVDAARHVHPGRDMPYSRTWQRTSAPRHPDRILR
jgi:hypothetical protein